MFDEIGTAIKTSSDLLYSTLALEDRKSLSFNSNKYSLSLLLLFHFNSTITLILQLFNLYSIFYWKIISRKFYFIEQIVDWFENTFIYFNDKYISEKNHSKSYEFSSKSIYRLLRSHLIWFRNGFNRYNCWSSCFSKQSASHSQWLNGNSFNNLNVENWYLRCLDCVQYDWACAELLTERIGFVQHSKCMGMWLLLQFSINYFKACLM
jgi:hypothetical protein